MKAIPISVSFGMFLLLLGIILAAWANTESRHFEDYSESSIYEPDEVIPSPNTSEDLKEARSRASQAAVIGGSIAIIGSSLLSVGLLSKRPR